MKTYLYNLSAVTVAIANDALTFETDILNTVVTIHAADEGLGMDIWYGLTTARSGESTPIVSPQVGYSIVISGRVHGPSDSLAQG